MNMSECQPLQFPHLTAEKHKRNNFNISHLPQYKIKQQA